MNNAMPQINRKSYCLSMLRAARALLAMGNTESARWYLARYRTEYNAAPASTRRRWRCGK